MDSTSGTTSPGSIRIWVYNNLNYTGIHDTIITGNPNILNSLITYNFSVCEGDSIHIVDQGPNLNGLTPVDFWTLYDPQGQVIFNSFNNNSTWSGGSQYYVDVNHCNNSNTSTCNAPVNLNVQTIQGNNSSVQLSWNSSSNPLYGYEVKYIETSLLQYNGSTPILINVNGFQAFSTNTTINGLNTNTDYSFFVRSICDSNNISSWINTTYTTPSSNPPNSSMCCDYTLEIMDSTNSTTSPGSIRILVSNYFNLAGGHDTIITGSTNIFTSLSTYNFTACEGDTIAIIDQGPNLNGLNSVYYWALYNPQGQIIFDAATWGSHEYNVPLGHCNNNTPTCNAPKIHQLWDHDPGTSVKISFGDTTVPYNTPTNWEINYQPTNPTLGAGNTLYVNSQYASVWDYVINSLSPGTSYDFNVRQLCDSNNFSGWSSAQLTTIDTCYACVNYYIEMFDSGNDGWNGNKLRVKVGSVLNNAPNNAGSYTDITLQNGRYQMHTVQVCPGDTLSLRYFAIGTNNNEVSFEVLDQNFNTIYDSGTNPINNHGNWQNYYAYLEYIGYIPCQPNYQPLILGGIINVSLPNGSNGKAIELWANENINDLSNFGIGITNDGNGSNGIEYQFPPQSINAGESLLLTYNAIDLNNYFGTCFNKFDVVIEVTDPNILDFDGNDGIELFHQNNLIERFGHPEVNGTGQTWEYTNSWAYKEANNSNVNFSGGEWIIGALGCTNNSTTIFNSNCPYPACSDLLSDNELTNELKTIIYPNPANDIINIKSTEEIEHITLRDMLGKVVHYALPNNNSTQINVSNLPKNIYLLEIKTKDNYIVEKIVISH